jgi:hypothetical protein
LLLLLLTSWARAVSASPLHLRMLAAHLRVTHLLIAHLILMLAAHTHLLLMLSLHLLLAIHHLLIHGMLALTRTSGLPSLVAIPGLISFGVVVVAGKILSPAFISGVLVLTFFAVFFTAHSGSLALMFSEVPRSAFALTFFAMFFTGHSGSLTLMFSEVSRSVFAPTFFAMLFAAHSCSLTLMFAKFVTSSCSGRTACGPYFLCAFARANAFILVE